MDRATILLLVLLVILLFLMNSRSREGFDETIHISIAAYRDEECTRTVSEAFSKANIPGRLHFAIVQQNKEDSEDCLNHPEIDGRQIRSISLDYKEAKGPTYARYLCNTLYSGEDYVLQIDSHTRFVQGWDTTLVDMLKRCPSPKAALTHYPLSYDPSDAETLSEDVKTQVPVMCRSKWNSDNIPTFEAVMKPLKEAGLRRVPFMAGGMIFGPGQMFQEVPLDPGLDWIFVGEEVLLSARLFTHGWDLFTPSENVVLHHYERKEGPRFWQDIPGYRPQQLKSLSRVKGLLGIEEPDISLTDQYGMGTARSLQQFWQFSKLDPEKKTSDSAAFFCGD